VPISFRAARARRVSFNLNNRMADLFIAQPFAEPVNLQSPELTLKRAGWRVLRRKLTGQPRGQVVELALERNGQAGSALCWFQWGDQAFAHYLRARNILWSGWNLNRRDLFVVILVGDNVAQPDDLLQFAATQNWFAKSFVDAANSQ
jgi:hypothetical protein